MKGSFGAVHRATPRRVGPAGGGPALGPALALKRITENTEGTARGPQ